MNFKFTIFLMVLLLLTSINSCQNKDDNPSTSGSPSGSASIAMEKTNFMHYELVVLNVGNYTIVADSVQGQIGDEDIWFYKVNDSVIATILPDRTQIGKNILSLSVAENSIEVTVSELSSNNENAFSDLLTKSQLLFDTLINEGSITATEFDEFTNELLDIEKNFNALNDTQKNIANGFLTANQDLINEFNALTLDSKGAYEDIGGKIQGPCESIRGTLRLQCVSDILKTAVRRIIKSAALSLGASIYAPGLGTAIGAGALAFYIRPKLIQLSDGIGDLLEYQWIIEAIDAGGKQGFLNADTFENGITVPFELNITARTLNSDDQSLEVQFISDLLDTYNSLANFWNNYLSQTISKPFPVFNNKSGTIQLEDIDFLSLEIYDNSSVTGDISGNATSQSIAFTTSDNSMDQNFSFEVVFDDEVFLFTSGRQNGIISLAGTGNVGCNGQQTVLWGGDSYELVQIGDQCWFAENLRIDVGVEISDSLQWVNSTSAAWCYYDNDQSYEAIHGRLYNYYSIENEQVCPVGFHAPNQVDWVILRNYYNNNYKNIAPGALFSTDVANGTNESGFSVYLSGRRDANGGFYNGPNTTTQFVRYFGSVEQDRWSYMDFRNTTGPSVSFNTFMVANDLWMGQGWPIRCIKD